MSYIEFSDVSLRFENIQVFDRFNLRLQASQRVALLGASGQGKSTLLKLLSGIYQPQSGTINCQAKRIGYIFQEPRLLPWLTVTENLAQVLIPYGFTKAEIQLKITQLLIDVDLSAFAQCYPHQLSGGMAQRVSLARAFAIEPDLLLLDEPLCALDPPLKRKITQFIEQYLTQHQPSLIYVSHNPEDVLPLVQSCLLLNKQHPPTEHPLKNANDVEHIIEIFNNNKGV